MTNKYIPFCLSALLWATPSLADQVFTEDVIAQSDLCVGDDCADGEIFLINTTQIKLKSYNNEIKFEDSSTAIGAAKDDWVIQANEFANGGLNGLFFKNLSQNTTPFSISRNSVSSAHTIQLSNLVGIGTSLPSQDLHIAAGAVPGIRLQQIGAFLPGYEWDILGSHTNFTILDLETLQTPFAIAAGAPGQSLQVAADGNLGVGTAAPQAPLEVWRDQSFNFFRLTAGQATVNKSVDVVFTEGPLGTGQLRYNIVEAGDSPQVPEMLLDADGNVVLTGTLTTMGPTCAGGCDRVFDAGYPLISITEHSEKMFTSGHLPAIGPSQPHKAVNLTERQGNIINSLEHAHIYIDQLHQRAENQDVIIAQLIARLDMMENR